MGCFFGCFRIKNSNANLVTPSQETVAPRSKNALSSLFKSDDDSLRKGREGQNQLPGELDVKELKDEAKFLKARGTLTRTPVEIKRALEKWESIPAPNEAEKSKFNSWLSNASIERLKLEKQSDESPMRVKIRAESVTGSGSLLDTPSSCMTDGHNTERFSSSSVQRSDAQCVVTPMVMCDNETHSEISSVSTRAKPSSYPTPLKLTEELQTPGTVFPMNGNYTTSGQFPNVRTQYVNSVLDSIENPSQSNAMKDENSDSNHQSKSLKLTDEDNLMSTPQSNDSDLSVRTEMKDEESLTSWFKPISAKQDENNKNVRWRKTPVDRPILGMVAAHWNDDEPPHVSPKWWDGNGIPNSTNKYKEDQKVNWHATPFEERLEKALSEESLISQRKPMRTPPFDLNETEESDTAMSHLQSSAHLKSVVSF